MTAHGIRIRLQQRMVASKGLAEEGMGSFMDMAKFLASTKKGNFKDLEDEIGKEIYVDINGFHLYLADLRAVAGSNTVMAQVVSDSLGAKMAAGFEPETLKDGLRIIPIRVGGGK